MIERPIRSAVITGPTGAVGTALCQELAQNGITVYAVCRPDSNRGGSIPEHPLIQKVLCNLTELQKLPILISKPVDAFFHLGWAHTIGSGRNDMSAQIRNITHTVEAVQAAKALGCEVFIGAGSQAEYGPVGVPLRGNTPCKPGNGYGIAKLCAGQMSRLECQKLGLDHIWVRILSVYGPNDNPMSMIPGLIGKLLAGERPKLTEGIQLWDYLYSSDAARALRLCAQKGVSGKTYVLGSGTAIPLKEYILQIRQEIDPKLPLGFGEIPYAPGQVMLLQADITELSADTGFSPQVDFNQGIRQTIVSIKGETL